jgi:hypothetical protein
MMRKTKHLLLKERETGIESTRCMSTDKVEQTGPRPSAWDPQVDFH